LPHALSAKLWPSIQTALFGTRRPPTNTALAARFFSYLCQIALARSGFFRFHSDSHAGADAALAIHLLVAVRAMRGPRDALHVCGLRDGLQMTRIPQALLLQI
jgi:hypothetical protein